MRILCTGLLVGLGVAGTVAVSAQSEGAISAPVARAATLTVVERLVAAPVPRTDAVSKDPFHPPAKDLTDEVEKVAGAGDAVPDQERLEQIAAKMHPTGSVELGGEPYLLFTEKRKKIGDKVTVSIDAVEYEVEIVSIDKSRFRIRYKSFETTRSIK